jgi:hypothetical protein
MKKLVCALLTTTLLITGCQTRRPPTPTTEESTEIKSDPAIGAISSIEIGDNLYSDYLVTTEQTYLVTINDTSITEVDVGYKIKIRNGDTYKLTKYSSENLNAVCINGDKKIISGETNFICLVDKEDSGVFDYYVANKESVTISKKKKKRNLSFKKLDQSIAYKITENSPKIMREQAKFRREAIYQGVSKGVLKMSFMEFVNDYARPAFTQDIFYDMRSDGTATIAFKGLRVEILSVKGSTVQYKVLQPFSDSLAK